MDGLPLEIFDISGLEIPEIDPSDLAIDLDQPIEQLENWFMWVKVLPCKSWIYRCYWADCNCELTSDFQDLSNHLLEVHFVQVQQTGGVSCGVQGCTFRADSSKSLSIHLNFHLYHASLQATGVKQIISTPGAVCKYPPENNTAFGNEPLICLWDDCYTSYCNAISYFAHVRSHIDDMELRNVNYRCLWKDCNKDCGRRSSLRCHMHHHTGEKAVACPSCGRFFSNCTKLKDHFTRQMQTDSSNFRCLFCQKQFASKRLLKEHSRRHVKNIKCPFCELTTENLSEMRWHIMNKHAIGKRFTCSLCNQGYNSKADLDKHYVKHSDEKAFKCPNCDRPFKWKMSLQAHMRKHMLPDEQQYMCHLCSSKYKQGCSLGKHLKSMHAIELPSGHTRFTYKTCSDGYKRLQTDRYENANLVVPYIDPNTPIVNVVENTEIYDQT